MNETFLFGILGLLQNVFLPGFLLVRAMRLRTSFIANLVWTFSLSVLINYILVIGLTYFHIYTTTHLRFIFLLECVGLVILCWHPLMQPCQSTGWQSIRNLYCTLANGKFPDLKKRLFWLAVLTLCFYAAYIYQDVGNVFWNNDELRSWNAWATQWAANTFPTLTFYYPQLIPANLSISYVMMGSLPLQIQFFALAIMPFFLFLALLAVWDLAITSKQMKYFFAVITMGVLYTVYHHRIYTADADIPVSAMGFFALYALLKIKHDPTVQPGRYLWLGTLVCAAAAVTKQAGCFLALLYPVLSWYWCRAHFKHSAWRQVAIAMGQYLLLSAIVLPWYLYKKWQIIHGQDISNVTYLTEYMFGSADYWQRFVAAIPKIPHLLLTAFIFVLLFGWHKSSVRLGLLIISILYFTVWALWFSYDDRNLCLILPWMALLLADVMDGLSAKAAVQRVATIINAKLRSGVGQTPKWILIILVLGLFVILFQQTQFSTQALLAYQVEQQKHLLVKPAFGELLFSYQAREGFSGKIITNVGDLSYMPVISQYVAGAWDLPNYPTVADIVGQVHQYSPGYMIFRTTKLSAEAKQYLAQQVKLGNIQVVDGINDYLIYKVVHLQNL